MQVQLKEAILQAADESEVRVIVVTGASRDFCAGADMEDLGQLALLQRDYFSACRARTPVVAISNNPSATRSTCQSRSSRESMARSPASGLALLFFATYDLSRPTPR